ncbi:hypothetical protein ACZ90_03995 [Streptomyces albus subsp. albus]|nr:hypothetical protein ACZ90_03995 [Streptomyces albus subsp. albus]
MDCSTRTPSGPLSAEAAQGLIAGFGPGITAEVAVGSWAKHGLPADDVRDLDALELTGGVALSG